LQDCHKVEAALLKHTIILNPLLLLQLKLGEELFVVLFKRLNLQEKISDKLNALHVGLSHLHLLMMLYFFICRVGVLMRLVDGVALSFMQGCVHAVTDISLFNFRLFLPESFICAVELISVVADLHNVALALKAVN